MNKLINELNNNETIEVTIAELTRISELLGGLHKLRVLLAKEGTYFICLKY